MSKDSMLISAIIPAYNAGKYIKRCIKSIISQTYENWEAIVINDGSTDDTEDIVNELSSMDGRIKQYIQLNQGAGVSRNNGILKAKGDYIVFVDADDYIETDYFASLSHHNEDVVFVDSKRINSKNGTVVSEKMSDYINCKKDDLIRFQITGALPWGGWRKAVKRDFLLRNDILFTNHKVGEESVYSFRLMHCATTYTFIKKELYNYEVHVDSLSQTVQEDPWGAVALALRDNAKQIGVYTEYAATLNSFIMAAGIVSLVNMSKMYSWKKYRKKAKAKIREMEKNVDDRFDVDMIHLSKKFRFTVPLVRCRMIAPFYFAGHIYLS